MVNGGFFEVEGMVCPLEILEGGKKARRRCTGQGLWAYCQAAFLLVDVKANLPEHVHERQN